MAAKINILDEKVANQIAAGEVIERPASVVKELLENSIDAGSSRIQVEIRDGGRGAIRVLDNGEGIAKDDVLTAFQRHATSKIKEATDLFSIRTLGFRGEALPSIAAVSKVNVKTRTPEAGVGFSVKIEGGKILETKELGMAPGTDFLVEDLFYNTPARYKYLRTTATELGQISDIFNRMALAEPQVALSLSHNGKLVSRTPGTGKLKDAIMSIHGREMVEHLLEIDHEASYVQVKGYVVGPTVYRSSRRHQSFFVNGRYVRSSLLSKAVDEGFANLLPARKHPIVFLFIRINPIHVDVNVHPAKFEVKFSRPEIVAEAVSNGVRKALLQEDLLPTFRPIKRLAQEKSPVVGQEQPLFGENTKDVDTDAEAGREASKRTDANTDAGISVNHETENVKSTAKQKNEDFIYKQENSPIGQVTERLATLNYQEKNFDPLYVEKKQGKWTSNSGKNQKKKSAKMDFSPQPQTSKTINQSVNKKSGENRNSFIASLRPIGQIHQTYIIAEGQDGFYVIDQHVAHERILYEETLAKFRNQGLPSQTLLIPLTLELTLKEIQMIENHLELFEQMGFLVENFGGNAVMVRAVPKRVDERPDKDLFLEIVDLLLEDGQADDRGQLYRRLIITISCKGAVKAGQYLEATEIKKLLEDLSQTENPRFCPHGRPILFHISEHDLLKAFQRI